MQEPSISRSDFITYNQHLLSEIVSMAEEFIFDLREVANRTMDVTEIRVKYKDWIVAVQEKYILLSEADSSPEDLYEWTNEIMDLAGRILDISLLIKNSIGDRELWLIENLIRQYNISLLQLKDLEGKL